MKYVSFIIAVLVIFLVSSREIKAQTYDLVITKNGDSIACRIDSTSTSKIFFEMKFNGAWINTSLELEKVQSYKKEAIHRRNFIFAPGTSNIQKPFEKRLPKNSVFIGLGTFCYGRTFEGNPISVTVSGGLSWPDGLGLYLESTALFGRKINHRFEAGLATAVLPFHGDFEFLGIIFRCGYRYQGSKGFLFRSGASLAFFDGEVLPLPTLTLGYSF